MPSFPRGKSAETRPGLLDGLWAGIANEIASVDDNVRVERSDRFEDGGDIGIIHLRTNVGITELNQDFSGERRRKIGDWEVAENIFDPGWLQAPGVETSCCNDSHEKPAAREKRRGAGSDHDASLGFVIRLVRRIQ